MSLNVRYVGIRNSWGSITEDSFTQSNPPSFNADAGNTSATLDNQVNSSGVLGGSVAFSRPDVGSNYVGGPGFSAGAAVAEAGAVKPLGLFMNDAVGNAYENTPGIASGKGPYACNGGVYTVDVYETIAINAGTFSDGTTVLADGTLTYTSGLLLYASENGYLTCVPEDAYEVVHGAEVVGTAPGPTVVAMVLQPPTSSVASMTIQLKI